MKRTAAAWTVLLVLLVLTGCSPLRTGSGDVDHTRSQLDGVDGRVGGIRLLSVSIASPGARGSFHIAGDDAALLLTIANDGDADDELTAVDSDVAREVVLRDGDDAAEPRVEVPVPSGGVAVLREVAGQHLELSGLRDGLPSGLSVPVTFEFRDAGSVTLPVPVSTYDDVRPDRFSGPAA